MDLKSLKWQMIRGSFLRRLFRKAFLFASAILVVSVTQMVHEVRNAEPYVLNFDECPMNLGLASHMNLTEFIKPMFSYVLPLFGRSAMPCEETRNLSRNVFKELMEKGFLETDSKALCVGEGSASAAMELRELGVSDALGVSRHPLFSLLKRRFVYQLGFEDNSFEFVFSRALDRVSVPALLVLEIERILRPGGVGAMLVGSCNFYQGSVIKSALTVSSFLRSSDVVHVCGVGCFSLVIFRRRVQNVALFDHYQLPRDCPSVTNNRPYMKYIEPLVGEKSRNPERKLAYLASHMDISSRDRLTYISVGAREFGDLNIPELIKLYHPIQPQAFNLFMVDHNISVVSSHIKYPGTTFVYYPGLAGNTTMILDINDDEELSAPMGEGDFDFVSWFNETVEDGDFVVLRMNVRAVELNILKELFKTGAICRVDEVFLRCADPAGCNGESCGDCMSIFQSLRRSGLFVHQWMGD